MRTRRRLWLHIALIGVLVFFTGVAIAVWFDRLSATKDDLKSTISKAGVGVAFTVAAGLIATGVSRLIDDRRKRDGELYSIFREVVAAYNQAKSTRRRMAALGLLDVRSRRLDAEEAKELRAIMTELNNAQLRFEAIGRECQESDLFSRRARRDLVIRELRTAENYINKSVLDKWEADGGGVWAGAEPNVLDGLGLRAFIDQGFKEKLLSNLCRSRAFYSRNCSA